MIMTFYCNTKIEYWQSIAQRTIRFGSVNDLARLVLTQPPSATAKAN
jgi:hypothetical protein